MSQACQSGARNDAPSTSGGSERGRLGATQAALVQENGDMRNALIQMEQEMKALMNETHTLKAHQGERRSVGRARRTEKGATSTKL